MNKFIGCGRLTRDPEIRYSTGQNGQQNCIGRASIAINRDYKGGNGDQQADFLNVVAFGKSGEFMEKYLKKGMKMIVEGRIQTGSYTNKEGQKVYTTDLVVERWEFAESKNAGGSNTPDGGAAQNHGSSNSAPDDSFMNIPDGIDDEYPWAQG